MLWSIDSCHKRVSADQCHMTVSQAQVYNVFFKAIQRAVFGFQLIAGSGPFFKAG